MTKYAAVKASQKHIKFIKENIRKETLEATGLEEKEFRRAVKLSVDKSDEVYAWVMDGKAHALGGYSYSPENNRTSIWCVTTPLTDGHGKAVIEAGKQFVDSFVGHNISCCIDSTDERIVKLVEALGFTAGIKVHPQRHFYNKE